MVPGGALPRLLLHGALPLRGPLPLQQRGLHQPLGLLPLLLSLMVVAATYLKGISTTTFDESVCTISGYLEKAFAIEGTINADNPVTTTAAGTGFRLLTNPNSIVRR